MAKSIAETVVAKIRAAGKEGKRAIAALENEKRKLMKEWHKRIKPIEKQIERLHLAVAVATGKSYSPAQQEKPKRGGHRTRRSAETIHALLADVHKFISDHDDGVTGPQILEYCKGAIHGSVKAAFKTYAPELKIKTTGAKRNMKYFAA